MKPLMIQVQNSAGHKLIWIKKGQSIEVYWEVTALIKKLEMKALNGTDISHLIDIKYEVKIQNPHKVIR